MEQRCVYMWVCVYVCLCEREKIIKMTLQVNSNGNRLNLVGNLQTSDAGIYQCVAVNLGGTGTANYDLTVNGNVTFILTFPFTSL